MKRRLCSTRKPGIVTFAAVLSLTALSVFLPRDLRAQGEGDNDEVRAQELYESGARHYGDGEYEEALRDFKEANRIESHPILLYNIAFAYAKLGNYSEALKYSDVVGGAGRLSGRTLVKNAALGAAVRSIVRSEKVTVAISDRPEEERPKEATDEAPATYPRGGLPFETPGWVGIGSSVLGTGFLAGSIVVDASLAGDFTQIESADDEGNQKEVQQLKSHIRDVQRRGKIMLYTGAGLTTLGAALLIVDLTGRSEARPIRESMQIDFGFHGRGLRLGVSF